jgi:hypothetical protein
MEFVKIDKDEFRKVSNQLYMRDLEYILQYIVENFSKGNIKALRLPDTIYSKTERKKLTKTFILNLLYKIKESSYFTHYFYKVLAKSSVSKIIYHRLLWVDNSLDTQKISEELNISFKHIEVKSYHYEDYYLENERSLIIRKFAHGYNSSQDILYIEPKLRDLLKLFYPVPNDYILTVVDSPLSTKYHYSNENGILSFIHNIRELLQNNLIEFGKNNEKPMVKSLNLLSASTDLEDFFQEKKINTLALDMLTRSFYHYKKKFFFKEREIDTFVLFMEYQMKEAFGFTISRVFTSHLKKVKFGKYVNEENEFFVLLKYIISLMPKEGWVSFENILSHTYYRELYFDFEDSYKTENYEFTSDEKNQYEVTYLNLTTEDTEESSYESDNKILKVGDHYGELFHEPILKGIFFYMGALGLMELKYDDPITPYENIKAKDKPYISTWDGLKYVKLTKLGEYIFGRSKSYTPKEIVIKKVATIKFDEFKPIITVDKSNSIMVAKLEPFTEKLENDRYILTHTKLFRDCRHMKDLKLKIESFYTKIEKNPPKVFIDFFDEVLINSNLMKRNLKQVVIELESNKKLLNLFMRNHKLQELLIKAEGYRIIVFKDDVSKITKIVKDNGFFVEF